MRFNSVTGCCAAYNIANLGYAHGHTRAKTQEEFELRFLDKPLARMNFAITNDIQDVERGYLSKMGFKEIDSGSLRMHVISSTELRKYMAEREPHLREYEAEQKKQRIEVKKSVFNRNPVGVFRGQVTAAQIAQLRPDRFNNSADDCLLWRNAIDRFYGVRPMLHRWTNNTVDAVRTRVYRQLYYVRRHVHG